MFRFSCFHANVHGDNPKKTVQPSTEAMAKVWQDCSQNQVSTDSSFASSSNPLVTKAQEHKPMDNFENQGSNLPSAQRFSRSEDLNGREVILTRRIKKSQSLRSGHYREGRLYTDNLTEGDAYPGFSSNGSKSHNESTIAICRKHREVSPTVQCKKNPNSDFQVSSGLTNDASIFAIGDRTPSGKDTPEITDTPLSGDSTKRTSGYIAPALMKSCSLPNIKASITSCGKFAIQSASSMSRSSDDLQGWKMHSSMSPTIK